MTHAAPPVICLSASCCRLGAPNRALAGRPLRRTTRQPDLNPFELTGANLDLLFARKRAIQSAERRIGVIGARHPQPAAIVAQARDAGLGQVEVKPLAAAIPEPETYALMLAGLAAVGLVSRRRSRRV